MKKIIINDQTTAYAFETLKPYDTYVYLLDKPNGFYLIDTFCGPDAMAMIIADMQALAPQKRLTVINTHYHYDHIWGNCAFQDRTIIGQEKIIALMQTYGDLELEQHKRDQMGDVALVYPNITFETKMSFEEDGLVLFHSPGHTLDSLTVLDLEQKTLFVGDNLEKPLVFVEQPNLRLYQDTLDLYLDTRASAIMAGHTINLTQSDVIETMDYLRHLRLGEMVLFQETSQIQVHEQNIAFLSKEKTKDKGSL